MSEQQSQVFRLIRRQGQTFGRIERLGRRVSSPLTDIFHFLMGRRLWELIVLIFLSFLLANLGFALLYDLLPNPISNATTFADFYFFSVQTMATIGYGQMVPQSLMAHILVAMEAFAGLIGFAMGSGLILAHFARPSSKIMFSRVGAIHSRNGKPVFTVRLANERNNQILEGEVSLTYLHNVDTLEGESMRRFVAMRLERERTPVFSMTWTIVHPIDDQSPLFGKSADDLSREDAEFLVTFRGVDETFSQEIYARNSYVASEIRWNERFVDIFGEGEGGSMTIDLGKFHDTRPWIAKS